MKSPCFGSVFSWQTRDIIKLSSIWDITGAKYSDLDQSCGSRFPSTTMRYLARTGFPFSSFLMMEIAYVGRALPMVGNKALYSASDICSHVFDCVCKP